MCGICDVCCVYVVESSILLCLSVCVCVCVFSSTPPPPLYFSVFPHQLDSIETPHFNFVQNNQKIPFL